ncbi:MAG TPA: hypothetical protein VIP11_15220 [Gemmatimonadaceae bacterium]
MGRVLLIGGATVGVGIGAALLAGISLVGVPWLVAVGLTKLALLGAAGLIAAGAVCLRLDRRAAERAALLTDRSGD